MSKPSFDPNKPFEVAGQSAKPAFNPSASFQVAEDVKQGSAPEAFVQNFGQAATMGYLPQLQAIAEPAIQGVLGLFGDNTDAQLKAQGFNIQQPQQDYTQRRDQYIREQQALSEASPIASAAGQVAGGLSTALATPALFGARAAGLGGRLAQAAGSGAVQGAIRNPGDVEGQVSPLQLGERAQNVALDAATGAVFQGGLETAGSIGRMLKEPGKKITQAVQKYAFEAISPSKAASAKAVKDKSLYKIGQTVIDNDLIQPGAGIEDILINTEAALKKSGEQIGNVYDSLDSNPALAIKPEDIKDIATSYAAKAADRLSGTVDGQNVARKLEKVIRTIPRDASFSDLRKWRSSIDDQINFSKANKDLPGYQQELLKLRSEVQDRIAEMAGKVNPELKKQLTGENKNFSSLYKVKEMAENKAAANITNTNFGIREGFGAGIGAMVGSTAGPVGTALGAAAGGFTANALKKYGTPFVAMSASKIAKKLQENPKALGKFSQTLIDASNISPERFVQTVNKIIKDPEYKKLENGQFTRGQQ